MHKDISVCFIRSSVVVYNRIAQITIGLMAWFCAPCVASTGVSAEYVLQEKQAHRVICTVLLLSTWQFQNLQLPVPLAAS